MKHIGALANPVAFSTILDGSQIKSDKRLFCTATSFIYKSLTLKAKEQGTEIYGMDDQNKFGPVFHSLTFGEVNT